MAYKYESVVNVIGHINPDTDSVCSAIAYANLKSQSTGEKYIPKRAGQINAETQFVLKHFGVSAPDYMGDVRTQVIDIDVQRVTGVSQEISLKRAWELMKTDTLQTLPIVDASQKLLGLITIEDIALFIRRNVHATHENLTVLERTVGILEIDLSQTDGLYLGACKLNACLVFFLDKVVMPCFFVRSDLLCAFFINSHGKTSLV